MTLLHRPLDIGASFLPLCPSDPQAAVHQLLTLCSNSFRCQFFLLFTLPMQDYQAFSSCSDNLFQASATVNLNSRHLPAKRPCLCPSQDCLQNFKKCLWSSVDPLPGILPIHALRVSHLGTDLTTTTTTTKTCFFLKPLIWNS